MIPDEEIARMRNYRPSFASNYPARIERLLAERELLVAEHEGLRKLDLLSAADEARLRPLWQAVDHFK